MYQHGANRGHVANRHISISQSPYLHCDVILITALAAPVLIMTSFATELAMPTVTDK